MAILMLIFAPTDRLAALQSCLLELAFLWIKMSSFYCSFFLRLSKNGGPALLMMRLTLRQFQDLPGRKDVHVCVMRHHGILTSGKGNIINLPFVRRGCFLAQSVVIGAVFVILSVNRARSYQLCAIQVYKGEKHKGSTTTAMTTEKYMQPCSSLIPQDFCKNFLAVA